MTTAGGVRNLAYFQLGKEAAKGTAVAATRRLAPALAASFQPDFMQNLHPNRSTGRRNPITYATRMGTIVPINFQTGDDGAAFDELQWVWQFPSGATATGASAPYSWIHASGGTAAGSFVTFTGEFGDNVQEYEGEYLFVSEWGLSADVGGMTQMSASCFARQASKTTKTNLPSVSPIRIPSKLWKMKYASAQSGLAGASYQTGMLKGFNLSGVTTGLVAAKYLDGVDYYTAVNETGNVGGQLELVVTHSGDAITEFYDNAASDPPVPVFVELTALGPALNAGTYSADVVGCFIPGNPVPFDSDIDGETMLRIPLTLAYDDTWGNSIQTTVLNNRNTFI